MKINENTTIPLTWLAAVMVPLIAVIVQGTLWVSSVNNRLEKIESAMSISKGGVVYEPDLEARRAKR